jgi:hypothetical protein
MLFPGFRLQSDFIFMPFQALFTVVINYKLIKCDIFRITSFFNNDDMMIMAFVIVRNEAIQSCPKLGLKK